MNLQVFGEELRHLVTGKILVEEPMALHTTWRIGGPADLMLVPETIEDISGAIKLANRYGLPFYVIGNGSNLLVRDRGIRGLVIKMAGIRNDITCDGQLIKADAGSMMPIIARLAADNGLTGLEFAVGIPASAGGAVVMNAGAHGRCMADIVKEVSVLDLSGEEHTLCLADIGFSYRASKIKEEKYIVTKVIFALQKSPESDVKKSMNEFLEKRKGFQPMGKPNSGSVFKNPAGTSAGKLIDEAGCKGLAWGGAEVSQKHANFILNIDHATADDVLELIKRVQKVVFKKFNIELELEVQVIGE